MPCRRAQVSARDPAYEFFLPFLLHCCAVDRQSVPGVVTAGRSTFKWCPFRMTGERASSRLCLCSRTSH